MRSIMVRLTVRPDSARKAAARRRSSSIRRRTAPRLSRRASGPRPETASRCPARARVPAASSSSIRSRSRSNRRLTAQAEGVGFASVFTRSASGPCPSLRSCLARSLRAAVKVSSGPL